MDDATLAALQLTHTSGLGPVTCRKLLAAFTRLEAITRASSSDLIATGLNENLARRLKAPDEAAMERDSHWAQGSDERRLIPLTDPKYPTSLRQLPDAPIVLYAQGDIDLLHTPQLAVVGSRTPTPSGKEMCEQLSEDLAAQGLCITSGLALGIDTAAHQGALRAQGLTVAVTGTGLDRVYPAKNRELAHRIAHAGLLVSEFPIGTSPRPENFPKRNRIISGLSLATLVVEAALKSGSLITASRALEQGRDVFAMPGSIHNPLAKGCHQLIRQGAKLVECSEHVLEELAPKLSGFRQALNAPATDAQARNAQAAADVTPNDDLEPAYLELLSHMDDTPQSIDTYVGRSGLSAEEIASMLLILELEGHVASEGGGRYRKA